MLLSTTSASRSTWIPGSKPPENAALGSRAREETFGSEKARLPSPCHATQTSHVCSKVRNTGTRSRLKSPGQSLRGSFGNGSFPNLTAARLHASTVQANQPQEPLPASCQLFVENRRLAAVGNGEAVSGVLLLLFLCPLRTPVRGRRCCGGCFRRLGDGVHGRALACCLCERCIRSALSGFDGCAAYRYRSGLSGGRCGLAKKEAPPVSQND